MIIITCIDKDKGMLFNNRRQSKDRILTEHIINLISNSKIWINSFSKELFEEYQLDNLLIDDQLLEKAQENDYCFIENMKLSEIEYKIDKIIIYNWNRKYPADYYFDINLEKWKLEEKKELIGNSHENITEEIYIK